MTLAYFDANAGVRPLPEVLQRLQNIESGNPSSAHKVGQAAKAELETAREAIAQILGVEARRLVFTSGGSESVVTALYSAYQPATRPLIALAKTDHPNTRKNALHLAEFASGQLLWYPTDTYGRICQAPQPLDKISILSVQAVHSETGAKTDPERLRELLGDSADDRQGALLHIDACQVLGKADPAPWFDLADLISFSGHKIGALSGIGLLYIRPDLSLRPLFAGEQEWRRRGGTENLFGAVSLAVATELRCKSDTLILQNRIWRSLLEDLIEGLGTLFDTIEWLSPLEESQQLSQTLFFRIPDYTSQLVLMAMDQQNISLSAGTACLSGLVEANETLLALGYSDKHAREALRISLDWNCDKKAIADLLTAFHELKKRRKD